MKIEYRTVVRVLARVMRVTVLGGDSHKTSQVKSSQVKSSQVKKRGTSDEKEDYT